MKPLNYNWKFIPGFEPSFLQSTPSSALPVDLPHNAVKLPYHEFDERKCEGIFTYFLTFDDEERELPVKILHFDGVMLKVHLFFNGEDLGEKVSGFFPVEFDVSPFIKPKGNKIVAVVDSHEDPLIPPFGSIVDYLPYAGIYRKVSLLSHPSSYIEDVYPITDYKGNVKVILTFGGRGSEERPIYRVYDGNRLLKETKESEFLVEGIEPYSPEQSKLYRLETHFNGQAFVRRIGFRTYEFKEEGFYLNGKKAKLIGLNRHQSYPHIGMAVPDDLQKEDARILKLSGINVVRTSHYADDESFLDALDELGLFFLDEVPGWQYIGNSETWRKHYLDFVRRLVLKERHHPSLLAFGLRIDESQDDHELYSAGNAIQKELDPYHPSIGVRNFTTSELLEDIYGYNDFSCRDTRHGLDPISIYKTSKGKPKLVTENNGHMFPTKPFDPVPRRVEHALRHARVMEDALAMDGLCGELSWCAFDYATHSQFGSGDRICYHGIYDAYRCPKPAAYFYKSQGEEPILEVANGIDRGDENESFLKPLIVFTNMDYVKFYRNEDYIGDFHPNKKEYPNLPHPPIWIDDFIGNSLRLDGYSEKELRFISKCLNGFGSGGGMDTFSLTEKAYGLKLMKKHGLSWPDLQGLYQEYMSNFGPNEHFRIVGYKDGAQKMERIVGISRSYHYEVSCPDTITNADCYGAIRVYVAKRNQFSAIAPYSFDVGHVEIEGPMLNLGEEEFTLLGGQTSIFLRGTTVKKPTIAKLKIRFASETIEREILVK